MKKELLKFMFRSVSVMIITSVIALAITIFSQKQLAQLAGFINILFVVQGFLVVHLLLKSGNGVLSTCSGSGYSRSTIIKHIMLTILACTLSTWLCFAIPVVTNLRSVIQAFAFDNPMYPLMQPVDLKFIFKSLFIIIPVTTAIFFDGIIKLQPKPEKGHVIFYYAIILGLFIISANGDRFLFRYFEWTYYVFIAFTCLFSAMLVTYSIKMFKNVEIR